MRHALLAENGHYGMPIGKKSHDTTRTSTESTTSTTSYCSVLYFRLQERTRDERTSGHNNDY